MVVIHHVFHLIAPYIVVAYVLGRMSVCMWYISTYELEHQKQLEERPVTCV